MEILVGVPSWLVAYLVGINLWTFLIFGYDKAQAKRCGPRTPERVLLSLAFFGGSAGAKLAQRVFRHKTRKRPFAWELNALIGLQAVGLVGLAYYLVNGGSLESLLTLLAEQGDAPAQSGTPRRFGPGS